MIGKVPADAAELDALVEQMKRHLRPGLVFHNAWVALRCREQSESEHPYTLSGVTPIRECEQRERDRDIAARCRALLEPHPGFRQLRDTYAALGVRAVFHNYAEYHGEWHSFSLFVRDEHLPALERLAQDELGLASDEEREKAAEAFRIYMLRHYDKDYEENRRRLPAIDKSPYRTLNDPL